MGGDKIPSPYSFRSKRMSTFAAPVEVAVVPPISDVGTNGRVGVEDLLGDGVVEANAKIRRLEVGPGSSKVEAGVEGGDPKAGAKVKQEVVMPNVALPTPGGASSRDVPRPPLAGDGEEQVGALVPPPPADAHGHASSAFGELIDLHDAEGRPVFSVRENLRLPPDVLLIEPRSGVKYEDLETRKKHAIGWTRSVRSWRSWRETVGVSNISCCCRVALDVGGRFFQTFRRHRSHPVHSPY